MKFGSYAPYDSLLTEVSGQSSIHYFISKEMGILVNDELRQLSLLLDYSFTLLNAGLKDRLQTTQPST